MSRHHRRREPLRPVGFAGSCALLWVMILGLSLGLIPSLSMPSSSRAQEDPHKLYLPLMAGGTSATPTPPTPVPPTPAPPTPPPGEEVYAQGFSGAYDLGDYLLMGEVVNNSAKPIYDVDLAVTFYDAAGKVLATGQTAPNLSRIEPQGRAPFRYMHFGAPEGIAAVAVRAASWSDSSLIDYRPLTILSTVQRTGAAGVVVTGQFRNDAPKPLSNVLLVTSFRNSRGEVVSVVFDYPLIGALQPGVVMEYTVETFDDTLADTVATVQGEGALGQ